MLAGALLLFSALAQSDADAPSPRLQQLADHFVATVTSGPREEIPAVPLDGLGEHLLRVNPGHQAEVESIARSATDRLRHGFELALPQAARQAALAFDEQRLERMTAFVEMRRGPARRLNARKALHFRSRLA